MFSFRRWSALLVLCLALLAAELPGRAIAASPPDVEILRIRMKIGAKGSGDRATMESDFWYLIRRPGSESLRIETLYLRRSFLERPEECSVQIGGASGERRWKLDSFRELPSLASNALVTDSRVLALEVGPFAAGDTLHVHTVTRWEPFLGFPLLILGDSRFPTRRVEFEAAIPRKLQPRLLLQNRPPGTLFEEDEESGRWSITLTQVPPLPREALMPSAYDLLPVVSIGVSRTAWGPSATWPEMAETYRDHLEDRLGKEIPAVGIPNARERWAEHEVEPLDHILDRVQCNVRYISIQLGEGGWIPTPSREVARRRYGDCKDMALLLRDLLLEKGFAGSIALVLTRPPAPVHWDPLPSLGLFNHAVSVVESGSDLVWLDATDDRGSMTNPRWDIQNAPALVISGNHAGYHRIPRSGAGMNRTHRTVLCRPGPNGSWLLTLRGEITGYAVSRFRARTEGLDHDAIAPLLLGEEVESGTTRYLDPKLETLSIAPNRITFAVHARTTSSPAGGGDPSLPAVAELLAVPEIKVFRKRTRSSDANWGLPWSRQDSVIVEFPPGSIPEFADSTWSAGVGGLAVATFRRMEPGRMIFSREVSSNEGTFPAQEWAEGRRLSRVVSAWLRETAP